MNRGSLLGQPGGRGLWLSGFGVWTLYLWLGWTDSHNLSLPPEVPWQAMYLAMSVALLRFNGGKGGLVSSRRGLASALDWACALIMMAAAVSTALAFRIGFGHEAIVAATALGCLALGWSYAR